MDEPLWIPLVDEPIGDIVARLHDEDAETAALVASPRRQLAFRTFAYLRVGLLLGELLLEADVEASRGPRWIEDVLADHASYDAVAAEVRAVAREVAADATLGEEAPGDESEARERFRRFARRTLGA